MRTVEVPTMPPAPPALLTPPARPEAPLSGSPETLLRHAVEYGAYVGKLESQNKAWRDWARGAK